MIFSNGALTDHVLIRDSEGNILNAGDGGILFADGVYHWYGLAMRPLGTDWGGQKTDLGVVMYASANLKDWSFEEVILPIEASGNTEPMRYERPKILYNARTGKYILWCHYVKAPGNHGFTDGTAEAGAAVCDRINGTYRWLGYKRPIDDMGFVRDCGLFSDEDGSAYFIYDRHVGKADWQDPAQDRCLYLIKLTDDYLDFTDQYVRIDAAARREAPVLLKDNGIYYLITSGMTSWDFNRAACFRAEHVMGPWEPCGDPCIGEGSETTFNSQPTAVFYLRNSPDFPILILERHNVSNMLESSHIWLTPVIDRDSRTLSLKYIENLQIPEAEI